MRVPGRKSFVTSGGSRRRPARAVQGEAEGTADVYLLDAGQEGVRADGVWDGLGMAGNSSVALELDGVELDTEALIGGRRAIGLVFTVVAPFFLVGLAAVNVGIAAAAAAATEHARPPLPRRHDARRGAVHPAPARRHGHRGAHGAAARAGGGSPRRGRRRGGAGRDHGGEGGRDGGGRGVTQLALQATGGQGYTPALPIERHLRDARAGSVMAPTNAVLRSWIGKALAGLPVP